MGMNSIQPITPFIFKNFIESYKALYKTRYKYLFEFRAKYKSGLKQLQ